MNAKAQVVLSVLAIATVVAPATSFMAIAEDVPGALADEWEGKKPCENLFEDDHVRVASCTFPKGRIHICHTHPSYLTYVLSGGQAEVQDDKGKRKVEVVTGAFADVPPISWHEKYQPAPVANRAVCPLR